MRRLQLLYHIIYHISYQVSGILRQGNRSKEIVMETGARAPSIEIRCRDLLEEVLELSDSNCELFLRRSLNEILLTSYVDSLHAPSQDIIEHAFDALRGLGGGGRKVCQRQFKRNDIVWICKSCQKDETCVQCNSCFQASNHQGHEVFFYHSHAGGCCDCGDQEAWDPQGFCPLHGHETSSASSSMPDEVMLPAQRIIPALYAMVLEHINIYSPDHEDYLSAEDSCRLGKHDVCH